jgi:hypothetical protein
MRCAHRHLDNCVLRYSTFRHPWRSHAFFQTASRAAFACCLTYFLATAIPILGKFKSTLCVIVLMVFESNVGVGNVKSMRCAYRNPLRFLNPVPWVQLTFYLQPQKVSKKGRSPNYVLHPIIYEI